MDNGGEEGQKPHLTVIPGGKKDAPADTPIEPDPADNTDENGSGHPSDIYRIPGKSSVKPDPNKIIPFDPQKNK